MGGCVLDQVMTQQQFADLVGVSQQAVSDMQKRGVLRANVTGRSWLLAYCEHLREEAAGRAGTLAEERAGLDRARREEIEMRNATKRRELVPVAVIELVLAKVGRQVAGILGGLTPGIRLRWPEISADQLRLIDTEIARARNLAATMSPDVLTEPDESEGD